jgi:hypothetical protein
MSKFLLLHDNENKGKPAAVRADLISSVIPSVEYPEGSSIYILICDGEDLVLEARESVEEIYSMLNK